MRNRFRKLINKSNKKKNIITLIGCSIEEFNSHIEINFLSGMSWKNKGSWHFDHIIPCSYFDLTNLEEQEKCFHYTNFQPLWSTDNLIKHASLPTDFKNRKWKPKIGWVLF